MLYILDNQIINNQPFEINGVKYPANWCDLTSDDDKTNVGIISLTVVYPTITDGQRYAETYVDDLTAKTRTYDIVDVETPTPDPNLLLRINIAAKIEQQKDLVPLVLLGDLTAKATMQSLQDDIATLTAELT